MRFWPQTFDLVRIVMNMIITSARERESERVKDLTQDDGGLRMMSERLSILFFKVKVKLNFIKRGSL